MGFFGKREQARSEPGSVTTEPPPAANIRAGLGTKKNARDDALRQQITSDLIPIINGRLSNAPNVRQTAIHDSFSNEKWHVSRYSGRVDVEGIHPRTVMVAYTVLSDYFAQYGYSLRIVLRSTSGCGSEKTPYLDEASVQTAVVRMRQVTGRPPSAKIVISA